MILFRLFFQGLFTAYIVFLMKYNNGGNSCGWGVWDEVDCQLYGYFYSIGIWVFLPRINTCLIQDEHKEKVAVSFLVLCSNEWLCPMQEDYWGKAKVQEWIWILLLKMLKFCSLDAFILHWWKCRSTCAQREFSADARLQPYAL